MKSKYCNLILFICFFTTFQLFAQNDKNLFDKISAEIDKEMISNSKKIESYLEKSNPQLLKELKEKAAEISKITDEAVQDKATDDFQKKYSKAYNSALKKAGVDLISFADKLKRKYKTFSFEADDFSIYFQNRTDENRGAVKKSAGASGSVKVIEIKDFKRVWGEDCAGLVIPESAFTSNSAEAKSSVAVAGDCDVYAAIHADFELPADAKEIILEISFRHSFRVQNYGLGFSETKTIPTFGTDCRSIQIDNSDILNAHICEQYMNIMPSSSLSVGFGLKKRNRLFQQTMDITDLKGKKFGFSYAAKSDIYGAGSTYARATAIIEKVSVTVKF